MTIKELYHEAILNNETSLILLLNFLLKEKQVISMTDNTSVLDLYFKPNNKARMNQLLREYGGMKE